MLKKVFFLIILFLALPSTVFAIGFGEITVFSNLNEPLKAHIQLTDTKSVKPSDIKVNNASQKTYNLANLPNPDSFNRVKFKTRKEANGSIVVELTSKRLLREPFITFIAEMKWRGGHLVREYTFLLDPPKFVQKQIKKSTTRSKTPKKSTAIKSKKNKLRTTSKTAPARIDHSAVIAAHVNDESYGPTKRADTLWAIAKKVRPDNMTTYQTMQALFVLNPDAFIRGNIDLLRQGKTLTIPTTDEILKINGLPPLPASAKKTPSPLKTNKAPALSKQVVEEPVTEKKPTPIVEAPSEASSSDTENTSLSSDARLKILAPNTELLNKPVTSNKDLLLINKALKTSVATIQLLQDENESLAEQVDRLTEKLNNIDSKNDELNEKIDEISSYLKTNQKPADSTASAPVADIAVNTVSQTKDNADIQQAEEITPVDTAPVNIDSKLAQKKEKPESFVQELLTTPAYIFALGLITVLILIAILSSLSKRKKVQASSSDDLMEDISSNRNVPNTNRSDQGSTIVNNNAKSIQTSDASAKVTDDDMDFFEYFENKINTPDETPSDSKPVRSVESKQNEDINDFELDISDEIFQDYEKSVSQSYEQSKANTNVDRSLSEIDTYIAYGNYEKAEDLIQSSLQDSPADKDMHLKLLECYSLTDKRNEFNEHVERIVELLNVDMILRRRVENIYQQSWNETLKIHAPD